MRARRACRRTGALLGGRQGACTRAGGSATPIACDLGDLSSVDQAAQAVRDLARPLDSIVANAGIALSPTLHVRYGVEEQFLVNHIGHFHLITLLNDLIRNNSGRVVIVSSSASIGQAPKEGIMFDNLDGHRYYKPATFYGQSKLAQALFAKELSLRLQERGIAVNSVHPGAVRGTNLSVGLPLRLVLKITLAFMKSVQQGAATQVMLAASPLVKGVTGAYWADCKVAKGSKFLADLDLARRLRAVSEEIVANQVLPAD